MVFEPLPRALLLDVDSLLIPEIRQPKARQIDPLSPKQAKDILQSLPWFPINFVRAPEQAEILDEHLSWLP